MAAKPHTSRHPGLAGRLDSAILQREVFEPVFGISDPKNDPRLKHTGGDKALTEMEALLEAHPHAVAFTLSPLSAEDLLSVSDLGEVLPPKSTWIDPKIPYGLILYQHKKQTNNEKHYDPGNRRLRTDRLRTHHRFT
ncbi:DUF1015 domain-containing protein [Mucilaginibacter pineti]|uniref:hypothetical protein n=1 Tax=Mucilaginibacter pineti TaxID=1391627 RepID=UPI001F086FA4|nr:hypothetical protein [Mucilaginibacter pineti]